jgi:uncharacterized repeat protein (TIGR04052 family)
MRFFVCAVSTTLVLACGVPSPTSDGGSDHHHHELIKSVRFAAKVGASPFACGQTYALGTPASQYQPRDLRFYVSDVTLISELGGRVKFALEADGTFQSTTVAMLDFEDATGQCSNGTPATHTTLTGEALGGHYAGIEFTLGVPFAQNHQDATAATAPLNSSALFWSWQAGYKFLRADGVTTGLPMGHNVHLGSTGCMPGSMPNEISACSAPNRVTVALTDFDPETSTVVFDLAALLEGSNLDTNMAMTAPGCMSGATDLDCVPIFDRLGLPFGTATPTSQRVFTVQN